MKKTAKNFGEQRSGKEPEFWKFDSDVATHFSPNPGDDRSYSLFYLILRLFKALERRRIWQFCGVVGLMIIGALAELMAIGAILPFLSLIASPDGARSIPIVGDYVYRLSENGWEVRQVATVVFVAAAILAAVIRMHLTYVSQKFVFSVTHEIGVKVFSRGISQPYPYYLVNNSGVLLSNMEKVQVAAFGALLPLMNAISSLVISSTILVALLVISYAAALAIIIFLGAVYCIVSLIFRRRLNQNSHAISYAQTARINVIQEGRGAIRDILLLGSQDAYVLRLKILDQQLRETQAINAFIGAAPRYIIESVGMTVIAVIALMLASGPGGIATALPILGAMALGSVRLLPLIQLIYNGWTLIAGNRRLLCDVIIALELPARDRSSSLVDNLEFRNEIAFNSVSFAYEGSDSVPIDEISFKVLKGSRVGIVGETGSGKSTLMDLLLGLLIPTAGHICIDGVPLTNKNISSWQMRISHVPQSIFLTDGTIAENIAFGVRRKEIDSSRVRLTAEQAALSAFIEAFPKGYDTEVGERGIRLSGGQRQKIGIARALYRQAEVLVLDEATSALDGDTEASVMAALDGLESNLTVFMIAHRISTLKSCDMIISMPSGKVVQYSDLVLSDSKPARFVS